MQLKDLQPGDKVVLIGTVNDLSESNKPGGFVSVEFDNGVDEPKSWGVQGVIPCRRVDPDMTVEIKQSIV